MAKSAQRLADIELGLPGIHLLIGDTIERIWRDMTLSHQHKNPKFAHEVTRIFIEQPSCKLSFCSFVWVD